MDADDGRRGLIKGTNAGAIVYPIQIRHWGGHSAGRFQCDCCPSPRTLDIVVLTCIKDRERSGGSGLKAKNPSTILEMVEPCRLIEIAFIHEEHSSLLRP